MDTFESFEECEDIKQCESVYFENVNGENSNLNMDSFVESMSYKKIEMSQSNGTPIIVFPGSAENWEETDQLDGYESVHLESNISKNKLKSNAKYEEDIDLLLLNSQQDLDVSMAKTAGRNDLLDQTSENIDGLLLNIPVERKKSLKHKESSDATEDFGAVPERKKSKKKKDKDIDENIEDEGGDTDKKKKKRKKKDSKSSATSRAPSPTSMAPTEPGKGERREAAKPSKWSGFCVPMSSEKPYRGLIADRFNQITRDVNNLDTAIHYLNEKENLFKIRMLKQKYWHKPESNHSKQVQTNIPDEFIPRGPNQSVIPTRPSGESRGASMDKYVYTHMPITLSYQIINPAPVATYRPVSNVDKNALALAAAMTKLATSQLEEARVKRERDDKLISMNNKLMDSLQSLGRCVEKLAVNRAPVHVNQYNAMPANVAFYQQQLSVMDEGSRKLKNQYLEQEPIYSPGNTSYDKYPFEIMKDNRYMNIGHDDYKPTY